MLNSNFVILGTLISTLGMLSYIIDTVKGKVKPNRITFFMWSIAPCVAFAAMMQQGVGISSLMTLSTGVLPLLVIFASFANKKATWNLKLFDMLCGLLSLIGLAFWLYTKIGTIAIISSIIADVLAAVPTLKKAYFHPETESIWPWLATSVGVIITLLTLSSITFTNSGFLLCILIVNSIILYFVQSKIGKKANHLFKFLLLKQ